MDLDDIDKDEFEMDPNATTEAGETEEESPVGESVNLDDLIKTEEEAEEEEKEKEAAEAGK